MARQQFDPVAAAALGALDATERSLGQAQNQLNAPELPGQRGLMDSVRQAIRQVSQFSPPNVLASGQGPSGLPPLPGLQFDDAFQPPQPPQLGQQQSSGLGGGSADAGQADSRTIGPGTGESAFR